MNGNGSQAADDHPRRAENAPVLIDPAEFRRNFDRTPFISQHELCSDPRFDLSNLVELSRQLPESSVEYNAGTLPIGLDPAQTPRNGLSPEQTIERIATCKSWLVLKNVEQVPEYRALLDRCLDGIADLSESIDPGMHDREGFIFITSPGSVTPLHIDPEHNFLLQVRGRKHMYVFDRDDRTVISSREIENFMAGAHRNIPYRDEFEQRGWRFTLNPGDALHMPITFPHWVKNGDEVSISFSITFQTVRSERQARAHRMNARLRRWGVSPAPVGRGRFDSAKCMADRLCGSVERLFGRGSDGHSHS